MPAPEVAYPPDAREPRRTRVRRVVVLGSLTAFGPLSIDMYLPGPLAVIVAVLSAAALLAFLTLSRPARTALRAAA